MQAWEAVVHILVNSTANKILLIFGLLIFFFSVFQLNFISIDKKSKWLTIPLGLLLMLGSLLGMIDQESQILTSTVTEAPVEASKTPQQVVGGSTRVDVNNSPVFNNSNTNTATSSGNTQNNGISSNGTSSSSGGSLPKATLPQPKEITPPATTPKKTTSAYNFEGAKFSGSVGMLPSYLRFYNHDGNIVELSGELGSYDIAGKAKLEGDELICISGCKGKAHVENGGSLIVGQINGKSFELRRR